MGRWGVEQGAFGSQVYFEGSPQDLLSDWVRGVNEREESVGFYIKWL